MNPQKLVIVSASAAIAIALTVHAFSPSNQSTGYLDTAEPLNDRPAITAETSNLEINPSHTIPSWMARRECPGCNLQGTNLKGMDLAFMNLQGANLQGADLGGADLQGTNLQNANLQGAKLDQADLREANLAGANLSDATLQQANLEQAVLEYANFERANLDQANLKTAEGDCTDLQISMDADETGLKFHLNSQPTNRRSPDTNVNINVNTNEQTATMRVNASGCQTFETVNFQNARMPNGSIHP